MPPAGLLDAVRSFCEAPGNDGLAERLAIARQDDRIEAWLQLWPPGWKDYAGDAWMVMRKALKAEGTERRAHAAVLKTYFDQLEAGRRQATQPKQKPSRPGPRRDAPARNPLWYEKDN